MNPLAVFDIFLLEALLSGVLLGGVLALLSLGLNLVFGVIDVVWICYAELIMLGMYGMYYLYTVYHAPIWVAAVACIVSVGILGVLLHVLVIAPLLGAAPINQLLATGGVLFFLQSAATVLFGIEFKNLGLRLPVLKVGGMFVSYSRLLAFAAALIGMVLVYLWLTRTYTGTAIRAIHPFVGLSFGPITFLICVLGSLGNFVGGFVAAFVFAEIISVGGLYLDLEWGYVFAFAFFIVMMFIRPQGLMARRS
ncbi:MAG: branched-chain amino acid ABC transporter permease [Candidatus Rokuibacteriota bacterium]|nr:MAG: branched-chain amino acid ABC transporter permease [Candidatus Rokubacteria bacterium]